MESQLLQALLLTALAASATALGGLVAILVPRPGDRMLAHGLAFSAGVMIYVSAAELVPDALAVSSAAAVGLALLAGLGLAAMLDRGFSSGSRSDVQANAGPRGDSNADRSGAQRRLLRVGLLSGLAITLHNLPEGAAVLFSSLNSAGVGLAVALAVALHNVPEGLVSALPVYRATGRRGAAFGVAALSGLAEFLGAALMYALLQTWMTEARLGLIYAGVSGVMVYIALRTLLPEALRLRPAREPLVSLAAGMALMQTSLWML
jgi:ZIP family zinc transporter